MGSLNNKYVVRFLDYTYKQTGRAKKVEQAFILSVRRKCCRHPC